MKNNIDIKKYDKMEYITYNKLLEYNVDNIYTLNNLDFGYKESNKEREENYNILAEYFNVKKNSIYFLNQIHSDNICILDEKTNDIVKTESGLNKVLNVDGVITSKKDIVICSNNADCILFGIYDKKKEVIGNIHSGWSGTAKKILEKALLIFLKEYNSNPEDLIITISPSIRKCHFEVDKDVKDIFKEAHNNIDENKYIKKCINKNLVEKYYIDLVYLNRQIMRKYNILDNNIIDLNICSVCNKDKIHSYRGANNNEDKEKRAVFAMKMNKEVK